MLDFSWFCPKTGVPPHPPPHNCSYRGQKKGVNNSRHKGAVNDRVQNTKIPPPKTMKTSQKGGQKREKHAKMVKISQKQLKNVILTYIYRQIG